MQNIETFVASIGLICWNSEQIVNHHDIPEKLFKDLLN